MSMGSSYSGAGKVGKTQSAAKRTAAYKKGATKSPKVTKAKPASAVPF